MAELASTRRHCGKPIGLSTPPRRHDPALPLPAGTTGRPPYRTAGPLNGNNERLDYYPGFATWWRQSEALLNVHRSNDRLPLIEQLDYRHKLTQQLPIPTHRVVYSKGGMYLTAARISNRSEVIDHTLYGATAADIDEARYLTATLNCPVLTELVRPLPA